MLGKLTVSLALFLTAASVQAQTVSEVKFERGTSGATISGTIIGNEYIDYQLGAKGGQGMFAELRVTGTNGHGTVYFNILPPGSDGVAIYNGSVMGESTTLELPEDGTYTIRVYQMGNDRDAGKTSGFEIEVFIQ